VEPVHLLLVGYEQEFLVKLASESFESLTPHDPGLRVVCGSPMGPREYRLEFGVKKEGELGVSEISVARR
jgi:hypothetical protein